MADEDIEKLQKIMTINENGEGEINEKTIRELEAEAMQKTGFKAVRALSRFVKHKSKHAQKKKQQHSCKILSFLRNYVEIIVGIIILLLFVIVFNSFKSEDPNINSSLLGGLFSGLGAIIAILLSIAFSKRSNTETLDATVLPYIIICKEKETPTDYFAFEYFSDEEGIFDGWRPFDFEAIKQNKRVLVRNGIAYLHLKNIGLGSAKKMRININNFSFLILSKDYLQPNETMNIILNFNNPSKSQDTSIRIEYDTIRNIHHEQRFSANITWHLDRTNFTLFN